MFTGLVEELGELTSVTDQPPGKRLVIQTHKVGADAELGSSIAINGCCLTVVHVVRNQLTFEAGPETLSRTNLGLLTVGSRVNLERSLSVGDRLGGHFVTGHVDEVGLLDERIDDKDWSTFWFSMPHRLTSQMVGKGSIAIDGVSLTLVDVADDRFSVALIPHTLQVTTLGRLQVGDRVNLETDLLAKYVQQQLRAGQGTPSDRPTEIRSSDRQQG